MLDWFISLSVCTFMILPRSRRYPKWALANVTRRVSKTSPKIFRGVIHQRYQETSTTVPGSSIADHHQDVDSIQSTAVAWDSCPISSYTHAIRLMEFCYAPSSAGDGPRGGTSTWRQHIPVWSKWRQRIIITFPAPNAVLDIQNVWPTPFRGLARKFEYRTRLVVESPLYSLIIKMEGKQLFCHCFKKSI